MKDLRAGSIRRIDTWLPGTLMVFDNSSVADLGQHRAHRAVGIVVSNDGDHTIVVAWPDNCAKRICEYDTRFLNAGVIRCLTLA
jgi:hypothetical protein